MHNDKILAAWRQREHERERRELWRTVATAIAGATGATNKTSMREWADEAVRDYDTRFRP